MVTPTAETVNSPARTAEFIMAGADIGFEDKAVDLAGKCILVVEDELLIGLELEQSLTEAGCAVAGPADSIAQATQLIEEKALDAALLDVNLAGRSVDEVAGLLADRGVPFAFATGAATDNLPSVFADRPVLQKPFSPQDVLAVLRVLLLGRASTV